VKPIRTLVIDDEPLIRERVRDLAVKEGLDVIGEAANGLEALDMITSLEPQLVFIDVEMPELSGLAVLAEIEPDKLPAIIFITAYEHYARQAFDVGAIDYIYKPVTPSRFSTAVERARQRLASESIESWREIIAKTAREAISRRRKRFVVRRGNSHLLIPVEEVDWIDVADNYLRLHAGTKTHFARGTMKQAEDELDPERFVRVHRSAMVAVDRIASVRSAESGGHLIELRNGAEIRSSRQYAKRIGELLR
jgi:two-component system LytT family response regulator